MAKSSQRLKNRSANVSSANTKKIVPLFREQNAVVRRALVPLQPAFTVSTIAGHSRLVIRTSSQTPTQALALHQWQQGYRNGKAPQALFNRPAGLAVSPQGHIFVADTHNHCIRKITPQGQVTTWAGTQTPGSRDGSRRQAQLTYPTGLALDTQNYLYTPAPTAHTIRRISPQGQVTSIFLPGKPSAAIAIDHENHIYIGCTLTLYGRSQHCLARWNKGVLALLVKSGEHCQWLPYQLRDDTKPFTPWSPYQKAFPQPIVFGNPATTATIAGLATAADGTLYLATQGQLMRLTPELQLEYVKGSNGLYHHDRAASVTETPFVGLSVDAQHHLYVVDAAQPSIRKLSNSGYGLSLSMNGEHLEPVHQLQAPHGLAMDRHGRIYISDTGNGRICQLHSPVLSPALSTAPLPSLPPTPSSSWFKALTKGITRSMKQFFTPDPQPANTLTYHGNTGLQLNEVYIGDILATASRSEKLVLVRELLALYRTKPQIPLSFWRTCWQHILTHPDISVRTMLLREIPHLVEQEPEALMWIALLAQGPEPNRILRKQSIQLLDYLGKSFHLYSHTVPLIVDFMGDRADDVVATASEILMGIREQGFASLVDPLVEELAGG